MDVKITDKKDNKLMKRKEVHCDVMHSGEPTPKKDDVRKNVAGQLNVKENLTVLVSVKTLYGGNSRAVLHIYSNEKDMMKLEKKHLLMRNKIIKSGKEEEAEKAEEAKPEKTEVKEDGKEEKGSEDKGEKDKEEKAD